MLVATAGHIDHGKTALVRALTGVETDRLPEERARGISIDLGFAYWQAAPDLTIGFVDVPGHERFVRNMLAGIGGVDLALLVVAADDGVMPQTREHLQILCLMGLDRAVVAITKTDRVDAARIAEVCAEVSGILAPTPFANEPIVEIAVPTGAGITKLAALLRAAAADLLLRADDGPFRLAIDRAFTVTGTGTVVTGTILDGAVAVGASVMLAPTGSVHRVRGLHSAGTARQRVAAGSRCAVNLVSLAVEAIHRGDWLCTPGSAHPTQRIEAQISIPAGADKPLPHDARIHLHLGTADHTARVLLQGTRAVAPGESARVWLTTDTPVLCRTGDWLVVRDAAGRHTLGGGAVIDPFASPRSRRGPQDAEIAAALGTGSAEAALTRLLAIDGHEVDLEHFSRCFGLAEDAAHALADKADAVVLRGHPSLAVPRARIVAAQAHVIAALAAFHTEDPSGAGLAARELLRRAAPALSPAASAALLRKMTAAHAIAASGPLLHLPGHKPVYSAGEIPLWNRASAWLGERGDAPFTLAELVAELGMPAPAVEALLDRRVRNGEVWRIDGKKMLLDGALTRLSAQAAALAEANGGAFTAAQFRDATGLGRNFAIDLLEFLDCAGLTARQGEARRMAARITAGSGSPASSDS